MSRRQVRRMVRWESIIVANLGAAQGITLGVTFGVWPKPWPTTVAKIAVPFPPLAQIAGLAVVSGLLAGLLPARRASRMTVPEAIATAG